MHRLRTLWSDLLDSLWFLPALIVGASVAAAVGLVELQGLLSDGAADRWPRLLGAGAEGARGMLTAIATSMITVAGVVFSITIVALSLAASQYSPRVLRSFMSDRPTQVVMGAFVGIFAYSLIVLRTIRSPEEDAFVPSLAVLGAMFFAFVGVALLIYFIHHLAKAIQAPYIVARIAGDTTQAIERLFPSEVGTPAPSFGRDSPPGAVPDEWVPLPAQRTGYVVGIDGERLLSLAAEHSVVLRIVPHVGDFVIEGMPIVCMSGRRAPDEKTTGALVECFTVGRERNVHQDAPFGIQQLVDVAMKALSPGINDPSTAIACVDHLGALLVCLSKRRTEGPFRCRDGILRVIAEGPDFASMVSLSFDAITDHAGDHAEVLERLLDTLARIEEATLDRARRAALLRQLDAVVQRIAAAKLAQQRREALLRRGSELRGRCARGSG
ncbi:DUF2254 domain-containing protein [Piscinibacter sp.]|uniref:DUF2254 domain-containing protein n=1 Tax=Piscinibacter sp. TaxID=1903157 RepID=UPI002C41CFD6|nr:DUF2254 domain-containing protein [Albitalea sp.]HUG21711.1 DUF2254 domain-containing protein [Albitalea sp.]